MTLSKFLDPKNDLAFKRIFATDRNKDILIHLVNDIFARIADPILEVTFITTELEPEIESQRASAVDIMCKTESGERFIVEMQVARETGFENRAQFYASKAYIEQRTSNPKYRDLNEVTFLAIANFQLFRAKTACISHHHILDIETHQRDLKDFSFSFIELSKFHKTAEQLDSITDKWLYFFKHADDTDPKELAQIIGSDLIIKRAYDELDRYAWSDDELRAYETSEMHHISYLATLETAKEDGSREGEAIGLEKGEAIGIEKTARKLVGLGIDFESIMKATGLSLEKIEQLKVEQN